MRTLLILTTLLVLAGCDTIKNTYCTQIVPRLGKLCEAHPPTAEIVMEKR